MASTHKHIRSSTASKRPTTAIADGQIALNTNAASAGLFFKDSTGATIIKVGPVHVGTTAPNATPAAGGSSGNSTGEVWLDTSLTPNGVKIWNGSSWTNATPIGSTTVQGLLELATNAETQTGSDTARAVTPAGLQSKVSDSISTTSSTTIASSTAVKTAYDLANAALPKAGGTITGNLEIGTTGSLTFEGATADAFETTLAVTDPTADRTITLPDVSGNVVTTGDTGTVTSTMIADGTIVDADVNASAAIGLSKLATGALPTGITVASANIVDGTIVDADVNASAAIAYSKLALTGTIVDADISASAEIAVSKLADGAARQLLQTDAAGTGVEWTSNVDIPGTLDVVGAATFDSSATIVGDLTVDTNTLYVDSTNNRVGVGTTSPAAPLAVLSTSSTYQGMELITPAGDGSGEFIFGVHQSGSTAGRNIVFKRGGSDGTASESCRIDASGRLLVGTSTYFDVGGTADSLINISSSYGKLAITSFAASTDSGEVALGSSRSTTPGSTSIVLADDSLGLVSFSGDDGTDFRTRGASIEAFVDGTPGANDMPGRLVFSTTVDGASSPTEAARINSSGNLLVGVASSNVDCRTHIYKTVASGDVLRVQNASGSTSVAYVGFRYGTGTGTETGYIATNGTTTSYNTSSDYRLKENVTAVTDGITRLQQLKPSRFNFIADPDKTVDGFLAHEVQTVVPEAIHGAKDEVDSDGNPVYQGIDQSKLVPLLTAALQEAVAEINALKDRLTAAGI